jgi:integrase
MSSLAIVRPEAGIDPPALLEVKGKSVETTTHYRRAAAAWIAWAKGRPLTAHLFAAWIESERRRGTGTAKLRVELFGGKAAIMGAAVSAGMSARELAGLKTALDSIPIPKVQKVPDVEVLDGRERHMLISAMSPRMALVVRFLYATAARVSEAVGIRESDVKVDGQSARIRLQGKGRKERTVRIPLDLLCEINTEFKSARRVFLFEGRPGKAYCRSHISRSIGIVAKAELGRSFGAHIMRHSRATDLFAKSKNLKGVSEMLGHADISTTARYYVRSTLSEDDLWKGEQI